MNIGAQASGCFKHGMYPVVGWTLKGKPTYLMEMSFFDSAATLHFAVNNLELATEAEETSSIASITTPAPDLCFIPAFTGLQTPQNDSNAAPLLIGLTSKTSKAQILTAILRSIAFSTHQLLQALRNEFDLPLTQLSVDGGISKNDFILHTISDLQALPLVRKVSPESSVLGAAFLAGLSSGFFTSLDEVKGMNPASEVIEATPKRETKKSFNLWVQAAMRSRKWFSVEVSNSNGE